jgi:Spy/CpxP family protein refolding chaperone
MIIPKLGLAILLAGAACMAQESPMPPVQAQPQPGIKASPQPPLISKEDIQRFQDLVRRRIQGVTISQPDQRFIRETLARLPVLLRQSIQEARLQLRNQMTPSAKPPLERELGVPGGRWWTRPEMAQKLALSGDQTKKMNDIFQQFRLKLIDLNASVQKEETIMEPLLSAEQPEESRIVAQIDKVAQARAELEKANARMLLGIRRLLTPEQWDRLKAQAPKP